MIHKYLSIILVALLLGFSAIIFTKTDFIPRVKRKLSSNTNEPTTNIARNEKGEIYGLDVSHHQKDIDWAKVKHWNGNEISFVYIKATEGATYLDKKYLENFAGAQKNGLLVGSYHYFRTTSSVKKQFENFINRVDKNKQDLIPLIDVEEKKQWNDSEFHKNFQAFLDLVENHYGSKPMIYTVNSFYNRHLSGKYKKYHFLIGRYGNNPPNMRDRSNWTIWQFTEKGRVDGIPQNVDIDVMNQKYRIEDLKLKKQ